MVFLFAPVHGIAFLIVPLCMLSFYCLLAILIHEVRCGRTTTDQSADAAICPAGTNPAFRAFSGR